MGRLRLLGQQTRRVAGVTVELAASGNEDPNVAEKPSTTALEGRRTGEICNCDEAWLHRRSSGPERETAIAELRELPVRGLSRTLAKHARTVR